jgi:hypothetical protein
MRALRRLLPVVLAMAFVPFAAGAANAAPPGNDEPGGAVVLQLGDHVTLDTTEATTNAADDTLNTDSGCGAPFTNASVWYQYTPDADSAFVLDSSASSYTTGLMIFEGTPTPESFLGCGPDAVGVEAQAGTTYTVMVFSDTEVNGGTLDLTLKDAPKPKVHVTLAKKGVAFRGGAATLHGTYSCTHAELFGEVDTHLNQRAGRLKIQADAFTQILCDGKRHAWTSRLVSPVGTYAAGKAAGTARIIVCGDIFCSHAKAKANVHLKKKSAHRQWMNHPTKAGSVPPLFTTWHNR